jgi:PPP family 3-phenylpropionic acid transporter
VATIFRQTRVRALVCRLLSMSAAHGALYVFYSIHLADHHYSTFLVGSLWSLGVLTEIVVFFFMAACCRFGLRAILLVSFAAAVVRFLMIGWGVEWLSVIVLAQLLHGLTFGAYHAAAIAAINRWFPGSLPGARTGVVFECLVWRRWPGRQSAQRLDLGAPGEQGRPIP